MASFGSTPLAIRSSPRAPYSTIVEACVHTAPTPARTHGTARPTNGTRVVTAAPDWPVAGSIAHNEKVEYCGIADLVHGDAVGGPPRRALGRRLRRGLRRSRRPAGRARRP